MTRNARTNPVRPTRRNADRRGRGAQPYERLRTPLVRDAGVLRPASWDEALDRAAEGFRRTLARKGPDGIGFFSCSKATNEVNYLAQKLVRQGFGKNLLLVARNP